MDLVRPFTTSHIPEITATIGLVTYATTRQKLTSGGVGAGIVVAIIHMLHPWPAFFWLLIVFFLCGTGVTKIGHAYKQHLTQAATGGGGGEGARTSTQVFANSGFACLLILLHAYLLRRGGLPFMSSILPVTPGPDFPVLLRVLPIGIIAQYAAVAADTFSSELGILARGEPFMITAPWRRVPRGTNGGVTLEGLGYGVLGSAMLTGVAAVALRFVPPPGVVLGRGVMMLLVGTGLAGSVIDSVLGAVVQVTVTDRRTGKVVEGLGGKRVMVSPDGTRVQAGKDWLTNNGVNFVMAATASLLAMGWAYGSDMTLVR